MIDFFGKGKWAFWLSVCVLAALVSVPSALLWRSTRSYIQFFMGTAPGVIRPTRSDFIDRHPKHAPEKNLEFVEFSLKAGKAKAVELVGDFNSWKPGVLPLSRDGKNWRIMVPLPPGRYRYLFRVDGQTRLDPQARSENDRDGRKVSVRRVP